ncbi:MAG TPA: mechanosensitive ion channel domain-containing protein [Xanthomonadaceae bacterium]|nr:mechanosensitive ion channel domain-containing protein [Xanthomonadaceae bacterium]
MSRTLPLPTSTAPEDRPAAIEAAVDGTVGWLGDLLATELSIGDFSLGVGALLLSVLSLVAFWIVAAMTRRWVDRYARSREDERRAALYTVSRILYYTLIVIAVLVALSVAGIPMTKFAVFAGALGVGLGFGLQAIFNNFVSGLILLFDRSLKVGDFVELESGVHGEVRDIGIRATLIRTNDNIDIVVPNSEFVSGRVVNWTHGDQSRRLRVPFGVAYGSDKELAKKAALEAAAEVPFTLAMEGERAPSVWLEGFGDSSLDFELVVWITPDATRRPSTVRAAYTWALEGALARNGLEIPFPQRDHHLRSLFGLRGSEALRALGFRPEGDPGRLGPEPEPDAQLSEAERAELARNDALQEVEASIAREAVERSEREAGQAQADDGPHEGGAGAP